MFNPSKAHKLLAGLCPGQTGRGFACEDRAGTSARDPRTWSSQAKPLQPSHSSRPFPTDFDFRSQFLPLQGPSLLNGRPKLAVCANCKSQPLVARHCRTFYLSLCVRPNRLLLLRIKVGIFRAVKFNFQSLLSASIVLARRATAPRDDSSQTKLSAPAVFLIENQNHHRL